uniref:Major facilitator superfamily (MFS) profile domain-containing protein n=1 Tax=Eutreptiella gymnastica TaxID=73025 RepID=A0A7S1I0Y1_9EUGL|mmetsp:Transcript_120048/g.208965  ORF Transcript_120048/g.208965 Transcript_120048/m.208965 type:complete len:239 (+) Transcript_120048:707-1423(+)
MEETDEFLAMAKDRELQAAVDDSPPPFDASAETLSVLRDHWPAGLLCTAGVAAMAANYYLLGAYLRDWMITECRIDPLVASLSMIMGQAMGAAITPLAGWSADYFGVGRTNLAHAAASSVLALPVYRLFHSLRSPILVVGTSVVYIGLATGMSSSVFLWSVELFPVHVRGAGLNFYYNIGEGIGGLGPVVCSWLGNPFGPAYYTVVCSAMASVALATTVWMKQNGGPLQVTHVRDEPY